MERALPGRIVVLNSRVSDVHVGARRRERAALNFGRQVLKQEREHDRHVAAVDQPREPVPRPILRLEQVEPVGVVLVNTLADKHGGLVAKVRDLLNEHVPFVWIGRHRRRREQCRKSVLF